MFYKKKSEKKENGAKGHNLDREVNRAIKALTFNYQGLEKCVHDKDESVSKLFIFFVFLDE